MPYHPALHPARDSTSRTGLVLALVFIFGLTANAQSQSQQAIPKGSGTCVSTPEQQGMDSNVLSHGLRDFAAPMEGLHSLLIVRNQCLVVEAYAAGYNRDRKHYLNSATKVFLSALVGIAVHEKKLRPHDLVFSYLGHDFPPGADTLKKKITIRNLLTMSSGISWPQTATGENASDQMGHSPDWVRFILARPVAAAPGTVTNYSNGDSHLLSAVLQAGVGTTALEFARPRFFAPLGIEDVAWDHDPQGRSIGSAALQMRPIDMTKIGILYLNHGVFHGQRIIDSDWVAASLTPQVKMPTKGGAAHYGYFWWLYPDQGYVEAWGGAGQRIAIFRDLGIVVVMTANMSQDFPRAPFASRVYEFVRQAVRSAGALPANPSGVAKLRTAEQLGKAPAH